MSNLTFHWSKPPVKNAEAFLTSVKLTGTKKPELDDTSVTKDLKLNFDSVDQN